MGVPKRSETGSEVEKSTIAAVSQAAEYVA